MNGVVNIILKIPMSTQGSLLKTGSVSEANVLHSTQIQWSVYVEIRW
jgi:hypothetical protein